jgi:hypothetical protein
MWFCLGFTGHCNLLFRVDYQESRAESPGASQRGGNLLNGIAALRRVKYGSVTNDLLTGAGTRLISGLAQKHQ